MARVVVFGIKIQGESEGMKAAESAVTTLNQGLELGIKIAKGLKVVTIDLAKAFFGLAKDTADANDAVLEAGRRTGTTAEFISQMAFAVSQADVEFEKFRAGLVDLTAKASLQPALFKKWNVEIKNTNGSLKDGEGLLDAVADRMLKAGSASEKAAIGQELMGEAGRDLVPLLEQGADGLQRFKDEADALGLTISTTSALIADEFNNQLGKSADITAALKRNIGNFLLPVMTVFLKRGGNVAAMLSRWIKANKDLINTGIDSFLLFIADVAIPATSAGLSALVIGWGAVKLAVLAVQAGIERTVVATVSGLESMLGPLEAVARRFGPEGLANSIGSARSAVKLFKDSSQLAFDDTAAAISATVVETDALVESIGKFSATGSLAVREIALEARKLADDLSNVEEGTNKAGKGFVDMAALAKEGLRKMKAELDLFFKKTISAQDSLADFLENSGKLQIALAERAAKAQKDAADNIKSVMTEAFSSVRSIASSAFADVGDEVDGRIKTIGDAFGDLFIGLGKMILDNAANFVIAKGIEMVATRLAATTTIAAATAEGQAKAVAAHAGIPFVGIGIGLAAAATIAAIIAGFATFQQGGIVPGTGTGDIVPALLEPGELVVPKSTAKDLLATLTRSGGRTGLQTGGVVAPPAGRMDTRARPLVGNLVLQTLVVPSTVQSTRSIRDGLDPITDRLNRLGRTNN